MGDYWVFLVAYLLGTIPFAFLAGRLKKKDIRYAGSGNLGATNAYRLLGKKWGIAVLAGDAIKGGLAAYICLEAFGPWGGVIGGLLAMLGHSFNPYFGFKPSGKGVASGLGIISVLMPGVTVISLVVFIVVVAISRYVSLGSIMGSLTVIVMAFAFQVEDPYKLFAIVAVSLVVIRHRSNIQRILNGTEARFGEKKIEE
ncbi:MAG TPA: glycerol-3-phosphate 1-O-acyltransferase PlsY [Peptococcaceae bacterium]|nr:glycerol-3-phosphate 1-O-acyltransferase PlsY [Peptococcaceae bacterium]